MTKRRDFFKTIAISSSQSTLVSSGNISEAVKKKIEEIYSNVHVVDDTMEIMGVRYTERESRNGASYMRSIMPIIEVPSMLGYGSNYQRERPSVDIIEEFTLIQDKKSKLCRSDRDWVVQQFNKLYKEVKP